MAGGSTSFNNFSLAALVSFAALVAIAVICRNLLVGCCLSASSICAGSVMPCSAARLSRAAIFSCRLPRSPTQYVPAAKAIITRSSDRNAIATRVFGFVPEGISIGFPSRYAPCEGRDGENYRLVLSSGNGKIVGLARLVGSILATTFIPPAQCTLSLWERHSPPSAAVL